MISIKNDSLKNAVKQQLWGGRFSYLKVEIGRKWVELQIIPPMLITGRQDEAIFLI